MSAYRRGRPNKYNTMTCEGTPPPPVVGEYRIRYQHGALKYLGITNNLERRMREHIYSGKISDNAPTFEWMPALPGTPYSEIRKHEQMKISILKPEGNQNNGGGGRDPKYLNYYYPSDSYGKLGGDYYDFTDSYGKLCHGVQEERVRSKTIGYAISRVLSIVLKIIFVIVAVVVGIILLAYFLLE